MNSGPSSVGVLAGLRCLEFAGIGPAPHAAMVLADLGADVVTVCRPGTDPNGGGMLRGRRCIEVDLRDARSRAAIDALIAHADVVVEGFRPGVMERLGLGPTEMLEANPRLIYGRVTGWGQEGELASSAGHDLNYVGLTGLLHAIGRAGEPPTPPLNLVADFGGGSMLLLVGVLAALFERASSGRGQVVDAAMVDGAALLGMMIFGLRGSGSWSDSRGENFLDGSAPFYRTYACADGSFLAVAAIERKFYTRLLDGLRCNDVQPADQWDTATWPTLSERFATLIASRGRDEWVALFADIDACVTPVLSFEEAIDHRHARSRGSFVEVDTITLPSPAPRFSRTANHPPRQAVLVADPESIVGDWTGQRSAR